MTADARSSLRRLRTTPARKPRTECCCQPVAWLNASMLAPSRERSISMAADCFVPDRATTGAPFVSPFFRFETLVRDETADLAVERFFANFVIRISFGSMQQLAALPKPRRGHQAGGAGSRSATSAPQQGQ